MATKFNDDKVPRVAMQVTHDVLIASVQIELYHASLAALREDLLDGIYRTGVRQALIDLSSVEVMDSLAFESICDTASMARVMGADTVLTGVRPGVASALVELNVNFDDSIMALNLDTGLDLLESRHRDGAASDEEEIGADVTKHAGDDDAGISGEEVGALRGHDSTFSPGGSTDKDRVPDRDVFQP